MEAFLASIFPWVVGILVCAGVTILQLHEQYRSWPFGDVRHKAAALWVVMCLLDVVVGVLFAGLGAGISLTQSIDMSLVGHAYWGPAFVLPMIPLALRSPVRTIEIAGQEVAVGVTEYYDRVRLSVLRRIDDRQTALVRSKNYSTVRDLMGYGLTFERFESEAREHFLGLQVWSPAHLEEMNSKLNAVCTLPTEEERFRGLVSLLREQNIESIIEEALRSGDRS